MYMLEVIVHCCYTYLYS